MDKILINDIKIFKKNLKNQKIEYIDSIERRNAIMITMLKNNNPKILQSVIDMWDENIGYDDFSSIAGDFYCRDLEAIYFISNNLGKKHLSKIIFPYDIKDIYNEYEEYYGCKRPIERYSRACCILLNIHEFKLFERFKNKIENINIIAWDINNSYSLNYFMNYIKKENIKVNISSLCISAIRSNNIFILEKILKENNDIKSETLINDSAFFCIKSIEMLRYVNKIKKITSKQYYYIFSKNINLLIDNIYLTKCITYEDFRTLLGQLISTLRYVKKTKKSTYFRYIKIFMAILTKRRKNFDFGEYFYRIGLKSIDLELLEFIIKFYKLKAIEFYEHELQDINNKDYYIEKNIVKIIDINKERDEWLNWS